MAYILDSYMLNTQFIHRRAIISICYITWTSLIFMRKIVGKKESCLDLKELGTFVKNVKVCPAKNLWKVHQNISHNSLFNPLTIYILSILPFSFFPMIHKHFCLQFNIKLELLFVVCCYLICLPGKSNIF